MLAIVQHAHRSKPRPSLLCACATTPRFFCAHVHNRDRYSKQTTCRPLWPLNTKAQFHVLKIHLHVPLSLHYTTTFKISPRRTLTMQWQRHVIDQRIKLEQWRLWNKKSKQTAHWIVFVQNYKEIVMWTILQCHEYQRWGIILLYVYNRKTALVLHQEQKKTLQQFNIIYANSKQLCIPNSTN